MPTYEYECLLCNQGFEAFQSMKDDAYKTCPEAKCRQEKWGQGEVKRKISSGAGFIFKGGGFYITDYRSDSYKSKAKSDSQASSGSSDKSSSSSSSDKSSGSGSSDKSSGGSGGSGGGSSGGGSGTSSSTTKSD